MWADITRRKNLHTTYQFQSWLQLKIPTRKKHWFIKTFAWSARRDIRLVWSVPIAEHLDTTWYCPANQISTCRRPASTNQQSCFVCKSFQLARRRRRIQDILVCRTFRRDGERKLSTQRFAHIWKDNYLFFPSALCIMFLLCNKHSIRFQVGSGRNRNQERERETGRVHIYYVPCTL